MKKIFSLMLLVFASIVLVACSSKSELDGEYYWVTESSALLMMKIDGEDAIVYSEGTYKAKVNTKLKTLELEGVVGAVEEYSYEDGVLTVNITGVERDFYKKGSKAYDKAIKENNVKEDDIDDRKD